MTSYPTDVELKATIERLVPKVDLQNTGIKAFIKLLKKEFNGADLKPRKSFIKIVLEEAINAMSSDEEEAELPEKEELKDHVKPKKKGGGLATKKKISKELAVFLGKGDIMARTEIVKVLWAYIREHNLQNPENKREIFLDKKMERVFKCKQFTMFTMNKYIGAHIDPFKPVDLTPKEKKPSAKKRKRKDDPKNKTKRKVGTQPPYRLSEHLRAVVGKDVLPRPQVVQGIWSYIRENNLQNPDDKRQIICDEKLKKVMGGKSKVTMFNMNTHITKHLLERLDKSAYNYGGTDDQ
jgi:upstream activation factor subunit UAF30